MCFFSFLAQKMQKTHVNQGLECAAPKRWSKYTTLDWAVIQIIFDTLLLQRYANPRTSEISFEIIGILPLICTLFYKLQLYKLWSAPYSLSYNCTNYYLKKGTVFLWSDASCIRSGGRRFQSQQGRIFFSSIFQVLQEKDNYKRIWMMCINL